jgi:subtilase family serine protease
MRNRRRGPRYRPLLDELDDRCLLSGFSSYEPSGLTPAQVTAAYGLNDITFTSKTGTVVPGNGSGETIALIEMYNDPNIQSDLATFDAKYGLPTPSLTVVDQAGSQSDSGWALEESLDVEWAHAIAPGANILVVEAAPSYSQTQELQNLLNAVNTARNTAGVVAVSMSWGFNEITNESSYDSYFTTPSGHEGVTFIAASGDSGYVEYPSASPNVLSVGGTTLNLTSSGAYSSETAWVDSGGGYSAFEQEPSYQGGVQTSGARSTPDVAFDADPNSGVEVYSTPPGGRSGSWQVVGGTSLGSPSWAGIIAIVDQGRAVAGLGSLDGPTQTLPALYAAASSNFNSVASAPSYGGFSFGGFNPFESSAGYSQISSSFWGGFGLGIGLSSTSTNSSGETANTATGLGTPKGASLISDLVTSTLTKPLTFIDSGSVSSTGSGTTPISAPSPKKPVKHHAMSQTTTKHKTHAAKTERKLVNQAHTSAKHVSGIRLV